jgi:phage gp36-like protein
MTLSVSLITSAQVEARLSANVVRQIFDDDNDGKADDDAIDQLRDDATAWVLSWIAPMLGDVQDTNVLPTPYASELRRLALDAVVWMAAQRHPEYVRHDWERLKASNEHDLTTLRTAIRSIGEKPPDPAANVIGYVRSGDPDDPTPVSKFFQNTGIF